MERRIKNKTINGSDFDPKFYDMDLNAKKAPIIGKQKKFEMNHQARSNLAKELVKQRGGKKVDSVGEFREIKVREGVDLINFIQLEDLTLTSPREVRKNVD